MYTLSRLILALGILTYFYCCVLASVIVFPWSLIFVLIWLARLAKRKPAKLTAHGTARLSEEDDLRRSGALNAKKGLILGWLPATPAGRFARAMGKVLNPLIPAEEACRRFLAVFRKRRSQEQGELVRLPQTIPHCSIFAPTRSGKGVSCILPFIYTTEESFVCIDPKAENALLTAEHLRRKGFEIIILDPYKVVTQ
jgi:Type IV secretory system Conjugative DNA transfer